MASQFNLSFSCVHCSCSLGQGALRFQLRLPQSKPYRSEPAQSCGPQEFTWKDRPSFKFVTDRTGRLFETFVQLSVSTDSLSMGDVEVDLYTLLTGPSEFRLKLSHGGSSGPAEISFRCSAEQWREGVLHVDAVRVFNLPSGGAPALARLTLPAQPTIRSQTALRPSGDCLASEGAVALAATFSHADLTSELLVSVEQPEGRVISELSLSLDRVYEHKHYVYKENTPSGLYVEVTLRLEHPPLFVQSPSGLCLGSGLFSGTTPVAGALPITHPQRTLLSWLEPVVVPEGSGFRTFRPYQHTVTLKDVRVSGGGLPDDLSMHVSNTLNDERQTLALKRSGSDLRAEDVTLPPFKGRKPYVLNRRFLLMELRAGGRCMGDVSVSLHNLFCGSPRYELDLENVEEGGDSAHISFSVECNSGRLIHVILDEFVVEGLKDASNTFMNLKMSKSTRRLQLQSSSLSRAKYSGSFEMNLTYTSQSQNFSDFALTFEVMRTAFLRNKTLVSGLQPLLNLVPFAPSRSVTFSIASGVQIHYRSRMTSNEGGGLYGEYCLLSNGIANNDLIHLSSPDPKKSFSIVSQPVFFPLALDGMPPPPPQPVRGLKCRVVSGLPDVSEVVLSSLGGALEVRDANADSSISLPFGDHFESATSGGYLFVQTSRHQLVLQACDVGSASSLPSLVAHMQQETQQSSQGPSIRLSSEGAHADLEFYVMCECHSAVKVTCPECFFHPTDNHLYSLARASCDPCHLLTTCTYLEGEEPSISCTSCTYPMAVDKENAQTTYLCACGHAFGCRCKNCHSIPSIQTILVKVSCPDCQSIFLVGESSTSAKCKSCGAALSTR